MESVEREIYVEARPEQVWIALTRAEHFATWYAFGGAELDLRPGGRLVMRWAEHGEFRGFVEKVEPGRRFAYCYAVDPDVDPAPGNSNLVEFTLTPEGEGTRLHVVESGFDRLDAPADVRARHADEAAQGWDVGLTALAQVVRRV
ncbi:SRPBCC domain-containing protein [Kribbella sp. CA-293567]|uniref:SRPBCC domain-containing protein n=1 Tax=Kribbella sp. CA-293567 TaxID=3002436 RepID=UPI0022DDD9D4|nr:SRPBCC domain-containing protein [Kribbella sp. CA-293567]WBQ03293.1 SRPBCC domain-containing protein [Kribbella sp. CA-293567]